MDRLDLTKEVAEKLVLKLMAPFREALKTGELKMTLEQVQEMDRDLGVLGLGLANRYDIENGYQTALEVMARENVRLHALLKQERSGFKSDV